MHKDERTKLITLLESVASQTLSTQQRATLGGFWSEAFYYAKAQRMGLITDNKPDEFPALTPEGSEYLNVAAALEMELQDPVKSTDKRAVFLEAVFAGTPYRELPYFNKLEGPDRLREMAQAAHGFCCYNSYDDSIELTADGMGSLLRLRSRNRFFNKAKK